MSNAGDTLPGRLNNLMSEEARELRAFVALLEREQRALVDADADQLHPVAQAKAESVARLNEFSIRRGQLLAAAGKGAGREAIAAWLAGLPPNSAERRQWIDLLSLAERARELNRANGELIKSRLSHNQQALALLLSLSDQAALYGPDGQARTSAGGRRIDTV